jgi:hypothetical protein
MAIAVACTFAGCPCVNSVINGDPSIRWWLFSNFGANQICPNMLKRGVPLKFAPLGAASVGRFFPDNCRVTVDNASQTMQLYASGTGYVFLPVTRRVGFYAGVAVEYRPDFHLDDDDIYVWGRFNRLLAAPDLRLLGVENSVVNLATMTPLGDVATVIGQGLMATELGRGFTVVRQSDGDSFALGILNPPDKPPRQFTPGSDHTTLATDLTQVNAASRDYLGPLAVDSSGSALYIKLRVTGAPLNYMVVDKPTGDAWRQPYQAAAPIGPPPVPPLAFGTAPIGDTNRTVPVAQGLYYVVVENLAPAPVALGMQIPFTQESIGYASYAIEVGDRP